MVTFNVTVQHPVKGTLIFGQNRENKPELFMSI